MHTPLHAHSCTQTHLHACTCIYISCVHTCNTCTCMHVYIVPIYMLYYIFCSASQSIVNYRLSASRVVSSLKQLFFNAYTHYVVVCVDCVLAVIIRVMLAYFKYLSNFLYLSMFSPCLCLSSSLPLSLSPLSYTLLSPIPPSPPIGITLVLAPQLARSYHHLFPLQMFKESTAAQ